MPNRKSAAVMFTDIVKVTDMMAKDEDRKKHLNCPWPKMIIEEWEKNNEL